MSPIDLSSGVDQAAQSVLEGAERGLAAAAARRSASTLSKGSHTAFELDNRGSTLATLSVPVSLRNPGQRLRQILDRLLAIVVLTNSAPCSRRAAWLVDGEPFHRHAAWSASLAAAW